MTKCFLSLVFLLLVRNSIWAQQPVDYRSRTIYFAVTDRFNPQHPFHPYIDPEYPDATNTSDCFTTSCPQEDQWRKYWGGDIQGVKEKLNYLDQLGVSAVWLTPLMENVRAYEGGTGYGTGYHGYWVQNYDKVNAHFGDWDDVSSLGSHLRAHGMRYMQDITLNHSNPYDNHVFGRLFQGENDEILVKTYQDDFDKQNGVRAYKHYQDTQQCKDAEKKSDADWSYWQLHHCLLADLSGYNQHDIRIADYLIDAGKIWMDHGVQDFRLDAVKFPFPDFISKFTHEMIEHAGDINRRTPPYIVGEWSGGGVGDQRSLAFANDYDYFRTNILDFTLSLALNRFIGGSYEYSSEVFDGVMLNDLLKERVTAFEGRDTWQGTFIDNHDQIRTMVRLDKIGICSEAERERRMDLATVLLMTVRGIPIIYYGDEQYLANYDLYEQNGHSYSKESINAFGDDPFNRPGMKSWEEDTSAFQIIKILAALRKASPAIWKGAYIPLYASADVLVFERKEQNDCVLVAVNRGGAKDITVPSGCGLAPGRQYGLLERANKNNQKSYVDINSGSSYIHLGELSSLVLSSK
ncbi:Cyclomaltodextrin glucanotransferase [Acidisarcina polymorpha]|uniref:Cyclomaltodextrin glucanotransferase n=1 Tax=Acidisarcina polymorpha TaxID=2211140 RepID=A0A2Z5G2Z3_9BACT|nr:alpha-amylase family glycosyl hydrolase [Acidisarcina polymorpha]AXC13468.1 Cyclomaltodextrin glucanotransferase [Acidisarcina polymorpha]